MEKLLPRHVQIIQMIDEEVMLDYVQKLNSSYLWSL